ncbi:MAG: oligosaccharide flippase family protein [Saccharofermentanales bacterium]
MLPIAQIANRIRATITKARQKGFFHIVVSSTLVKIVSFISAIFLPRFLSKADYGLLTYVDNIRNYIMLINGVGITNATLRYCAKNETDDTRKGYFIASLVIGVLFDLVLIVVSIIAFLLIPFPISGARPLFLLMSLLPLFVFLYEDMQLLLRATFNNKKFSAVSLIYSGLMVSLQVGFAILWKIQGVILARYIAVIVGIFIALMMIKNLSVIRAKIRWPDKGTMTAMVKYGIIIVAASASSLIMQLNEMFIIGVILKDSSAIAEYKVASYILTVSFLLMQSVVVFVFPYFVRHMDDKQWIWEKFKKLFLVNAMVMIPLHLLLIITARPLTLFAFGSKYLNSVPIMQMLLIASLGQTIFRGLTANILPAIGEEKFNLKVNVIFSILHVFIDIWAIRTYGLNGAAIALSVVYYSSGIILFLRFRYVCKNDKSSLNTV